MNYKKAFYSKLEDCYLGVKIKDFHQGNVAKSGFSNLLKIKEQYFAHIKAYLDSQIEGEPQSHDIYNKLYTFFDSYLNESGTPFFNDTPAYKNIYAKVYSNSKDTSLFYKTQNLYYVKSDTLYQSLTLSDEKQSYEVAFDASEYKQNSDNTKNKIIFKLHSIQESDESKAQILIKVSNQKDLFPNLNSVFKQNSNEFNEDFLKDLKQNAILKSYKIKINEEELKKIFRSYKKQSEIDFFIHKNAREFLKEQFDLWMFDYLYKESAIQEWNREIIAHLQRIKNIAYEVIRLIGDFENELKAVWLKPKFAKKTEYVFSVDKLNPNLMDSIINDKGFKSQIKEWQELNLVDEDFNKEDLLSNDKYRYLPLDTKHFTKETKYKILSSFENLESVLNGELIKADNFQALNSLMPKYQGKVDLIYIDPPYNTGSDGFIYADNFNHASWLSLINNRLELSKELLNNKGSMFISIDDKEQARLKLICDEVFGEENFVANFVWNHRKSGQNDIDFTLSHNYNFTYSKNRDNFKFKRLGAKLDKFSNLDNDARGEWIADPFDAPNIRHNLSYPITNPKTKEVFYPPNGRCWRMSEEKFYEALKDNRIVFGKNGTSKPQYKRFKFEAELKGENINTIWLDVGTATEGTKEIQSIFGDKIFDTPKPEKLLKRIVEIASKDSSIVLDFFAGSGTTLAVAQKLKRKWLGVEMGEHFYNVIIPRLKKVIAGFQSGISKECDYKGGGAFRYYELESYEEALANCEYVLECKEPQKVENKNNYKGKDYAKCEAILDYRKSRKLIDKLNKGESVCLDMHTEYREEFDIFHTISNLMGWKIKRLFLDSKGIESCEFDNGEILNLDSLDLAKYPKLKNLIWW
ncbi:site-specific DNA-methyltransferase [Helicobacter mastomyrinus]|uniref:Site-specific DNA-methyltransferase n=1 Tax=Helicobacter mastomyrinus TaxID=287948 RepID=A0ABZ3F8Y1_9HELI